MLSKFLGLIIVLMINSHILVADTNSSLKDSKAMTATTTDYKKKTNKYWKDHLKRDVYKICRKKETERAGTGIYDKLYDKGTYYCACCGGDFPVYSSDAKFDSGTGWPSFYEPYSPTAVTLQEDRSGWFGFISPRTEVVCSRCGGHLGHVFDDGPDPTGKRYCMNSLALVFHPDGEVPHNTLED